MEKDEKYIIQLRDCFTGGYTLPQYCIDNGIKKPLFVSEEKFLQFMWEVHVQFRYDKRLLEQFSVIDMPNGSVNFSVHNILESLEYKNFSEIKIDDFDAIIFLTTKEINLTKKMTPLAKLTDYFIYKTYIKIPLLNFLQRYPQVKLILTKYPFIKRYKDGPEFYKELKELKDIRNLLRKENDGMIKTPLDKFGYTNQEVLAIFENPKTITTLDGTTIIKDNDNPLIKITNGKRETAYQPEHFQNKIYFVGSSHDFGISAPYDKTIASYLQKMLNDNNLPYRVENESQRYLRRYQDIFYTLNNLTPSPGDIIFMWIDNMKLKDFPCLDASDAFDPPHNYKEIFCIKGHFNELGYKILAGKYLEYLMENNFFRDIDLKYPSDNKPYLHQYGIPPQFKSGDSKSFVNEELETYKKTLHAKNEELEACKKTLRKKDEELEAFKKSLHAKNENLETYEKTLHTKNEELEAFKKSLRAKKIPIGALVMNCDLFTLYHQYLVEYAAARVTKLYLFVVEEDKSEFPFSDRIELVRQCVKHIPNVEILPSGKFINSQQTFSGYFNKTEPQDMVIDSSEDVEFFGKEILSNEGFIISQQIFSDYFNKASLQDVAVDSSEDVEFFGKEIAPTLGITIRFAGEPTDNVTRQYNETMKKILPHYGVEFCEIPRKEFGNEPISTDAVHEALKRGDFDKIKNLVPDMTLLYLRGRYSMSK